MKINITHVISGLDKGGAETMLFKLLNNINLDKYNITVISLTGKGFYGEKIENLGIPVFTLDLQKKLLFPFEIFRAYKITKKADLIQSWMYHADLFSVFLAKFFRKKVLFWGIRHNNTDFKENKFTTVLIVKINKMLSKIPNKIISCSENGMREHINIGYNANNFLVIPNGFYLPDLNAFNKSEKNMLDPKITKIIHVGRWNKLKDYSNLLSSLKYVMDKGYSFELTLCGKDIDSNNTELLKMIESNKLSDRVKLLGRRNDVLHLMQSSDVLVSSSSGEGFSNVIGEAMACETPCIVTDVGDSSYIVNNEEYTVPPKDYVSLGNAIINFINKSSYEVKNDGKLARQRVLEKFEISKVVEDFEKLYDNYNV
ncbi:glycosyltransferase [Pontibacillus yanchengensis]|uniref:Glycosyl transferase n=1 Tax=Pontibacillus yanchengensis Y32 TaxID=1385514 RepID=A0A0A2TG77_9BACI|nr:glycosyltransferase [Pontibacillus yanchengensis]KGP74564.1 glycosyl transferase [Pontibacillus yanchengensis Y32]